MALLPEKVELTCPRCGEVFAAWAVEREPATQAVCPACGFALGSEPHVAEEVVLESQADDEP